MILGYFPTEFDAKAIYNAVRDQLNKNGPFPMHDQETGRLQGYVTKVELDGLKVIAVIQPDSELLPIFKNGSMKDVSIRRSEGS